MNQIYCYCQALLTDPTNPEAHIELAIRVGPKAGSDALLQYHMEMCIRRTQGYVREEYLLDAMAGLCSEHECLRCFVERVAELRARFDAETK